jgi:PAS domain S-box-containing protein
MESELERRFRLVTEAISEVFWIVSADRSRTIYISPTYERVYGRPLEDVARDPRLFLEALHPDDRAVVAPSLDDDGRPFEHEYRIVRPDGSIRWIRDRGQPVRDETGAIVSFMGVAQDVTERKQLEADLHQVVESLALTTQATSDGIWDWHIQANTVWWSDAMYTRFGFDRSTQPSYEAWSGSIHPDDRARVVESLAKAIEGREKFWSTEYRHVCADGRMLDIYDRGCVLFDDAGKPVRMVGAMIDVTAHRKLEAQLRQAQKMEAVGQLAGGVAHDFNNILQAATLDLSLLRTTPGLPAKAASHADDIEAALEKAATLTRQLLVFSRREAMRRRPLDLNTKLMDLARLLRRTIGEDIALHLDLAPGSLPIEADPGMIDQVLLNLVLNARDAMAGGGKLAISTTLERGDACITVQDTGAGIPAEDLPRIFEPFFTTKEPGHGTGLGLATVHGIVEQHGGRIEVDSALGRGTTFRVFLPTSDGATAANEASPGPARSHGHETILLVEDEAIVRRSLRQVIEQAGYTVVEAENGPVALSSWDRVNGAIDLVVTDLVMPDGMTGRDLIAQLEARNPQLRVIYITGYGRQLEAGARHENLHKPVAADRLLGQIRASLDRA